MGPAWSFGTAPDSGWERNVDRRRRVQGQLRTSGWGDYNSVVFASSCGGGAAALTLMAVGRLVSRSTTDRVFVGLLFVVISTGVAAVCLRYGLRWTHGAARYLFVHTTLYFAVILLVLWVTGDLSWPVWRRGLAVVFAIATFLATSFLFLVAYGRVPGAPRDEPSQSSADTVPDVESNGTLLRTTYCGGHMH